MYKPPFPSSADDLENYVWPEDERARFDAYMSGAEPLWEPPKPSQPGHNDPLAGLTPWKIYQRCIWVCDEDSNTKIMLLCVSRFMDKDLRASSMSYGQIARDCGFSEPTAKRCAKAVAGTWLTIGVCKGRYVAGKGHENLYNGRIPQKWADELRRRILGGIAVTPDEAIIEAVDSAMGCASGVSHRHPDGSGVSGRHPENGVSGCQGDTGVSGTLERGITQTPVHLNTRKEREREGAPADAGSSPPDLVDRAPTRKPAAPSSPPVQPNGSGSGVPDPRQPPARVTRPTKAKVASDRRGTRLPPDWTLPDDWRDWALSEFNVSAAQVQREADTFRDHWHGVPPAQPRGWKSDWLATWRNWCRREKTFTPRARPVARPIGQAAFLPLDTCRRLLDLYPVKHISDWRHDVHGPRPYQPGCRFSPDTIRELGISHLTGAST